VENFNLRIAAEKKEKPKRGFKKKGKENLKRFF